MVSGGLMQLVAYGAADVYLMGREYDDYINEHQSGSGIDEDAERKEIDFVENECMICLEYFDHGDKLARCMVCKKYQHLDCCKEVKTGSCTVCKNSYDKMIYVNGNIKNRVDGMVRLVVDESTEEEYVGVDYDDNEDDKESGDDEYIMIKKPANTA